MIRHTESFRVVTQRFVHHVLEVKASLGLKSRVVEVERGGARCSMRSHVTDLRPSIAGNGASTMLDGLVLRVGSRCWDGRNLLLGGLRAFTNLVVLASTGVGMVPKSLVVSF